MSPAKKKKKSSNSPAKLFGWFLAILALAGFFSSLFFIVDTVTITGSSNYPPETILEASGIKDGDNLTRFNTKKSAKKIEKLPYVAKATVKAVPPTTIKIEITPSLPAANFFSDKGILLVSSEGKVLESVEESRAGLFNFYGTSPKIGLIPGDMFVSEDDKKDSTVYALLEFFERNNSEDPDADDAHREEKHYMADFAKGITAIDVTDRTQIEIVYNDRITVKIGTSTDLDYKINFASNIIFTELPENLEGTLELHGSSDSKLSYSFREKSSIERSEQLYRANLESYNESLAAETAGEVEEEESEEGEDSVENAENTEESTEEEQSPSMLE